MNKLLLLIFTLSSVNLFAVSRVGNGSLVFECDRNDLALIDELFLSTSFVERIEEQEYLDATYVFDKEKYLSNLFELVLTNLSLKDSEAVLENFQNFRKDLRLDLFYPPFYFVESEETDEYSLITREKREYFSKDFLNKLLSKKHNDRERCKLKNVGYFFVSSWNYSINKNIFLRLSNVQKYIFGIHEIFFSYYLEKNKFSLISTSSSEDKAKSLLETYKKVESLLPSILEISRF